MSTAADLPSPVERTKSGQTHPALLGALFGLFYFIQGINEPTEGMIAQPVRSLLDKWELSAAQLSTFMALLALPWSIKPVYGLLSDFVPLAGYHRKSYLLLASALAAACLFGLYALQLSPGSVGTLFVLLLVPTIGVAMSDVVVDALMVEKGQPLGLTGRFQSIQWTAIYGASILGGWLGGYLSQHGQQQLGFAISGAMTLGTLALTLAFVREKRSQVTREEFADTAQVLWRALFDRRLLAVGLFLFLWHFNPFSSAVLYLHMKHGLGLSEQFYGNMNSLVAVGQMLGSFLYAFYCRRVSRQALIHLSIVMGILATLNYWLLRDETSAVAVSLAAGFATGTATLVLLDLAAQVCPPRGAGTLFALFMSLSNLAVSLSMSLGGVWYEKLTARNDELLAFNILVGIGALFTAGCWLLLPMLQPRES